MIRSPFQTVLVVLTGTSSAAALALHGYLGSYSRYLADDFCSAGMARRLGMLRAVWYWYLNWTGRYSASALDAAFGLLGPAVTPAVTALVLLLWLGMLAYTAVQLLDQPGNSKLVEAVVLATIIVYVTLTLGPNVPQSLYWGQGMRSIFPPLILAALLVAHIAGVRKPPFQRREDQLHQVAICFLLALLIGGFNETVAALQLGGLVFACILWRTLPGWQTRKSMMSVLFSGALGACISIVIVALSPGNAIRQAFYPPPPALPQLLQMAWTNFSTFLSGVAREPEQRLVIVGAAAFSVFLGIRSQPTPPNPMVPATVLAAGIGLAFAGFIPAAYGLSDSPPERTLLVPAHLLTLTLMLEGFFLGSLLGRTRMAGRMPHFTTALLLAASGLIVGATGLTGGRLLSSRAAYIEYAKHWDAVDSQIQAATDRGEAAIWIQPINNWAGLNEPNDNPKFWLNQCLREYYGIEVLGLDIP